jgi:diketogulonate reductase-like aldo/keto reductase
VIERPRATRRPTGLRLGPEGGGAPGESRHDLAGAAVAVQRLPKQLAGHEFGRTLEAYRALERLLADGKVRAIGISNFMVEHLTALLDTVTVVPAVNQIELHPYFQQRQVQAFGAQHGILSQAWAPIGGITSYRDSGHSSTLQDPVIGEIATAHGKSPAQVMLRWHLQQGRSAIPKSTNPQRIAENFDVVDFELTGEQLTAIDGLDTGRRGGPEPADITLEAYGRPIPEA